jgi:hypothetical protein
LDGSARVGRRATYVVAPDVFQLVRGSLKAVKLAKTPLKSATWSTHHSEMGNPYVNERLEAAVMEPLAYRTVAFRSSALLVKHATADAASAFKNMVMEDG